MGVQRGTFGPGDWNWRREGSADDPVPRFARKELTAPRPPEATARPSKREAILDSPSRRSAGGRRGLGESPLRDRGESRAHAGNGARDPSPGTSERFSPGSRAGPGWRPWGPWVSG